MDILKATFDLYRESARDAARDLPRSAWAMAFLLLAQVGFLALGGALAPGGMAGRFVLGFIHCGLIGWYLALLDITVVSRRRLRFDDLRGTFGAYFWETMSILFLFYIPQLILSKTAPDLLLVLVPIAAIVFNTAPEALYQDRTQSTQLLGDAMRFMQPNWPEWLGAHLLAAAALIGWGYALTGVIDNSWLLDVAQLFGPFFGFLFAGLHALRLGGVGLAGVLSAFGLFAFVHFFMLFRGHLYRRLRTSNRRGRAWRARH